MSLARPINPATSNGISNGVGNGIKATATEVVEEAKTIASSAASDARTSAAGAAKTARQKLDDAREQVEDVAYEAIEIAERFTDKAKKRAVQAGDSVATFVQDRPLVALVAAFAAGGLLIGLLVRR